MSEPTVSRKSLWLRRGAILFVAAILLRALAERRPDKLAVMAAMAGVGVAVVLAGWLFANRREL